MNKQQLQEYLDKQKDRFINIYGGEIVRYASPSKPEPIKLGVFHPVPNLKKQEYEEWLASVEDGTYVPDTQYQERPRPRPQRPRAKKYGFGNLNVPFVSPSNRNVRLDDIPR